MSRGRGKTRKPVTHALVVIDRSGSMGGLVDEVRGGFNSFLDDLSGQVESGADIRVTVVLFDDRYELLANAVPVAQVPRLTADNYWARGMTALHDAIGKTIVDFEASTKVRDGDQVLLVVQTDGAENSSQEFRSGQIMSMLRDCEGRGWRTTYMGAGPKAWGQGRSLGFGINVNTAGDADSTLRSYGVAAAAAVGMTRGVSYAETVQVFNSVDVGSVDGDGDGDDSGDGGGAVGAGTRSRSAGAAA